MTLEAEATNTTIHGYLYWLSEVCASSAMALSFSSNSQEDLPVYNTNAHIWYGYSRELIRLAKKIKVLEGT